MDLLKELNYQGKEVRVVEYQGNPYFVGKDVAKVLGYSNTRKALIDHVDSDEKIDGVTIRDSIGREQNPILINESGLYSLVFSSRLESAKKFRKWVTKEVLPDIRKYGIYVNDDFAKAIIDNPQEARKEMVKYYTESERLNKLVQELRAENNKLKNAEYEIMELENKLEFLQEKPENNDWKQEANKRVRQLAPKLSSVMYPNFGKAWNEVYREMLYSQNINIKSKHTRRLKKMESNNVPISTIENSNILDTIGTDVEYVEKMFNAIKNIEDRYSIDLDSYSSPFSGL